MAIHRNYYHAGRSLTLELKMDSDDFGIIPSPLFHATGEVVLMTCIFSGTTAVIMPQWDVATRAEPSLVVKMAGCCHRGVAFDAMGDGAGRDTRRTRQ